MDFEPDAWYELGNWSWRTTFYARKSFVLHGACTTIHFPFSTLCTMEAQIDSQFKLSIPVIDIADYYNGDAAKTREIATALRSACQAPGFFQIVGHGVSSELRSALLSHLVTFFKLPPDAKKALHREKSPCLRGYETIGEQQLESGFADQKEGFMIGPEFEQEQRFLQGPNQWPSEADVPGFREAFMAYFQAIQGLSKQMFRLMALSLSLDEKYFDDFVGSQDCTWTLIVMRMMTN